MNTPALERIAFQHNSPLASGLIKICEALSAWVMETRPPNQADGKVAMASELRVRNLIDYTNKTFKPAIIHLFQQKMNLTVDVEVDDTMSYANGMMLPYYHDIMDTEDYQTLMDGEAMYSGTQSHETTKYNLDAFKNLADLVDIEKSKLKEKTSKYKILLWVFPISFLGEEVYAGLDPITPREHAAIILHEIGHGLGSIEHVADCYYRADVAANSVKYLSTTKNTKDLDKAATEIETTAPEDKVEFVEAIDKAKEHTSGFGALIATLGAYYLAFVFLIAWARIVQEGLYSRVNASANKSSDTVVTSANSGYFERISDEFVSRHGLGSDLVSCLQKIYLSEHSAYLRGSITEALQNHVVLKTALFSLGWVASFFLMVLCIDDHTYDSPIVRLEHILSNGLVVFKDENLSPKLRAYYINDTKKMYELIAKFKKSKIANFKRIFWGTIMRIENASSILDGIKTANLSRDYDTLQMLTNGLVKNPLAFHAARLQQIASKK